MCKGFKLQWPTLFTFLLRRHLYMNLMTWSMFCQLCNHLCVQHVSKHLVHWKTRNFVYKGGYSLTNWQQTKKHENKQNRRLWSSIDHELARFVIVKRSGNEQKFPARNVMLLTKNFNSIPNQLKRTTTCATCFRVYVTFSS